MAYETVVGRHLAPWMDEAGRALVQALEGHGMRIVGAFWLYESSDDAWKLYLVCPDVDTRGSLRIYEDVRTAIDRLSRTAPMVSLEHITVASPTSRLPTLLRKAIRRTGEKLASIRFTRNVIDGQLIEDALIYRML